MNAARFIARTQRRDRRSPLLVLAIVTAITAAAIGGLATGYRRTATAIDRWTAGAIPYDLQLIAQLTPEQVRTLPGVELAHRQTYVPIQTPDFGNGLDGLAIDYGGIDSTYHIVAGTVPAGDDVDDVLVNEAVAQHYGVRPGDSMTVRFFTQDQAAAVMAGDYTAHGQAWTVRVTGVVRQPQDISTSRVVGPLSAQSTKPTVLFSDRLYDGTLDLLRFTIGSVYLVELAPSADRAEFELAAQNAIGGGVDDVLPAFATSPPPFPALQQGAGNADSPAGVDPRRAARRDLLAVRLRHHGGGTHRAAPVRSRRPHVVGARGKPTHRDDVGGVARGPAVIVGTVIAVPIAWLVSDGLPIGVGHKVEPSPGRHVNVALTGLISLGWIALMLGAAAVAAAGQPRPIRSARRRVQAMPPLPRRVDRAASIGRSTRGGSVGAGRRRWCDLRGRRRHCRRAVRLRH